MRNVGTMVNEPLRAHDAVLVFIDLQEGIVNVGVTADADRLRTGVAALVDLAQVFSIPVAIACVPTTSGTVAPLLAEITSRLGDIAVHVRTTANALDDRAFRETLEASGRRTLVIAGIVSEVAVALAATAAVRLGYSVIIAVDACSGIDARSEAATFTTLSARGIVLSSVPAIAAELAGDFSTDTGRAAMRALQAMLATPGHAHDHDHEHGSDVTFVNDTAIPADELAAIVWQNRKP